MEFSHSYSLKNVRQTRKNLGACQDLFKNEIGLGRAPFLIGRYRHRHYFSEVDFKYIRYCTSRILNP